MKLRAKSYNQQGLINCNKCELNSFKALSWGNQFSTIVFVGTAPTQNISEDRLCFQSSKFKPLFQALKELGHSSEKYFYTNLIRCAVPGNRPLTTEERSNCRGILDQELLLAKPYTVICLGKQSGEHLYGVEKLYSSTKIYYPFEADVHTLPHPSYVNRFWKQQYEQFKEYLGKIL